MSGSLIPLGALALGAAAVLVATLVRGRARLELRTRLLELFALATGRGIRLAPLVARAAGECRGRERLRLERIHARLKEGGTLSAACAAGGSALFPAHVLAAVHAAEGTAALPGALDAAARDATSSLHLRHRWLLGLGYPALLGLVLALVFELSDLARRTGMDVAWPVRAAPLALGIAGGVAAAILVASLLARRLCIFEGARLLAAERLLRALAPHVAAGLPLPAALRRAAPACGNVAMAAGARDAARELEGGADPSRALPEIPLPRFVHARLALARDATGYASLADECAHRYRDRSERMLRWAVPTALLALGVAAALRLAGTMKFLESVRSTVLW